MSLILIRGIPGSGKTTMANRLLWANLSPGMVHLEADMFHVDNRGKYVWYMDNMPKAHEWCVNAARIFLNNGKTVIVSNTFTRLWEMEPYLEHAATLGISTKIYRMENRFKNIHNVPDLVVSGMASRFEDYEGEEIIRE